MPIPSYLIALAAGNVVYRPFPRVERKDWTSGVWAEPELIEAAYWEFNADTGRFLAKEEEIVPPYRFGVYDLLVLPPSFPYGGMVRLVFLIYFIFEGLCAMSQENACLTFLTPSKCSLVGFVSFRSYRSITKHSSPAIARSSTSSSMSSHTPGSATESRKSHFVFFLIHIQTRFRHAHATHFWLNEGWTTYMERLLLFKLYSPAARGFSYLIGHKALVDALKLYEEEGRPRYQRLVIEFEKGEDPDEAYSRVPYEKGSNFLLHIGW